MVITKTYDLILWSCNHTSRFPRQHRFVLGERLERTLYDLLETLIRAKYQRERAALLEAANLKLEIQRFQVRLAKDLQCLKLSSYDFASQAIEEIGRLIIPARYLYQQPVARETCYQTTDFGTTVKVP